MKILITKMHYTINYLQVPSGMTALMAAIEARDVDLVERLIAAGAGKTRAISCD